MGLAPYRPDFGQIIATDVDGLNVDRGFIANLAWTATEAAAASATAVHAAITASAADVTTVTTGITNPPCARSLTVTPGGTTDDVAACDVTITGTNINDETISETFAFLANASTATAGTKAFKTVTSISIPAQDGAAATFSVGTGQLIGLPYKLSKKRVLLTLNDGVVDTAPTLAISTSAYESNTVDFNESLDGSVMDMSIIV